MARPLTGSLLNIQRRQRHNFINQVRQVIRIVTHLMAKVLSW